MKKLKQSKNNILKFLKKWLISFDNSKHKSSRFQVYLILIILLAFIFRLYKINNPIGDWHAFRQADTASVTREYVKHGINLLIPRYHDLANIQSGLDNIDGYRMVEYPFINAGIALFLQIFPRLDLVLVSRLFSALFSLGTLIFIYQIARKLSGIKTAIYSALFFAILPYSVYYSRVILPEPFFLFFSTLSIYTFLIFIKNSKTHHFLISLISLALSFLLKPFVVFLLPVYLSIAFIFQKQKAFKNIYLYFFPLAIIPYFFWRRHIQQFPSGIPASDWLFNSNGIRLRPAWFRWLFYERLIKMILGYFGTFFLFTNFFKARTKAFYIYTFWWLGIIIYFIVIATGNVHHDYYQNLMLPILSISLGRGLHLLINKFKNQKLKIIPIIILLLTLLFSWEKIKGYYNINHWDFVHVGKRVDEILPVDAKVITPNFGDTHFLFATGRTGWPIGYDIENKIKLGAQYYISVNFDDETNELLKKCQSLERTTEYAIIDLSTCQFDETKNESEQSFPEFPTQDDVYM